MILVFALYPTLEPVHRLYTIKHKEFYKEHKILAVMCATRLLRKKKTEHYSGLNGIRTQDLCDAGEVLYQLSYQDNWEMVMF